MLCKTFLPRQLTTYLVVTGALSLSASVESAEVVVGVQVDRPEVSLSPVLYGLFFEDINYAADGGLYAELIQNRSFSSTPYLVGPRTVKCFIRFMLGARWNAMEAK